MTHCSASPINLGVIWHRWAARTHWRQSLILSGVVSMLTIISFIIGPYLIFPEHSRTKVSYVRPGSGDGWRTSVLRPDDDGILLSSKRARLMSPNGAYTLSLRPDGNLVLTHNDDSGKRPVWWTGTGDNRTVEGHRLAMAPDGTQNPRLTLQWHVDDEWMTVWHSDLEPACKERVLKAEPPVGLSRRKGNEARSWPGRMAAGQLELSNTGQLRLAGACNIFVPPSEREEERSLAVIVAGLYRTNEAACLTHMSNLVAGHPSFTRIDVFAYVLYGQDDIEAGQDRTTIENALRACYGAHLRAVQAVAVADEEVSYPGAPDTFLAPCGPKLQRLNNQLRTLDEAGKMWWAWAAENGYKHDTILRIRPDTQFLGDDKPTFRSLHDLGDNSLVLPHPWGEHYFYCAQMSGRVGVGPTDQIAYGSPAAMSHFLHMYRDFAQMVQLSANPAQPALRDFSGCEELPSGPAPGDCGRPAPCSIECMVAWYLEARGVRFDIEWGWRQLVLRS